MRGPTTVYSTDAALQVDGLPQPAPASAPSPNASVAVCYPSALPHNTVPVLYVADAPITPAMGSFYFEARVEELVPAPLYQQGDDDNNEDEEDDGPRVPPPVSSKPLPFVLGLASDRLKLVSSLSLPGLAPATVGFFNHQNMIYRGREHPAPSAHQTPPREDADDAESYGPFIDNVGTTAPAEAGELFVEGGAIEYGPRQRMRVGRVACVGCLVDFHSGTVRFTRDGSLMSVAALLGFGRVRHGGLHAPSLIPPRHGRHYPRHPNPTAEGVAAGLYPVLAFPKGVGTHCLVHLIFLGPAVREATCAPLTRFPFAEWSRREGEAATRREIANARRSSEVDEDASRSQAVDLLVTHFALRGMHDVVRALERETEELSPQPATSPGASSSSPDDDGSTPHKSSSHHLVATRIEAVYDHIRAGSSIIRALVLLRQVELSPMLPPAHRRHCAGPVTGAHFLSCRLDVCYFATFLHVVCAIATNNGNPGWAQLLVGSFDRVGPKRAPWLVDAIPIVHTPPLRARRIAAVEDLVRLSLMGGEEGDAYVGRILGRARERLCEFVRSALEDFLHDTRRYVVTCMGAEAADPNVVPTSTPSASYRSPTTPTSLSSLRSLVEDVRCNVALNSLTSTSAHARPHPNPLAPNRNLGAPPPPPPSHAFADAISMRLEGLLLQRHVEEEEMDEIPTAVNTAQNCQMAERGDGSVDGATSDWMSSSSSGDLSTIGYDGEEANVDDEGASRIASLSPCQSILTRTQALIAVVREYLP